MKPPNMRVLGIMHASCYNRNAVETGYSGLLVRDSGCKYWQKDDVNAKIYLGSYFDQYLTDDREVGQYIAHFFVESLFTEDRKTIFQYETA